MEWIFTNDSMLEETNTQFCIELLSGTWSEPLGIKVRAPKIMAHSDQTKYLRLGVLYAKKFMTNRHKFTSEYSAAL